MRFPTAILTTLAVLIVPFTFSKENHNDLSLRGGLTGNKASFFLESVKASEESSCSVKSEESGCNGSLDQSNKHCVWCKCSAIPNECMNEDQASRLPSSIFDCAAPNESVENSKESSNTEQSSSSVKNFNFKDGMTHKLSSDIVEGGLCDDSSLSRSGYMDITGSTYDTHGADKHYFYWMFEKRNMSPIPSEDENNGVNSSQSDGTTNTQTIPFIIFLSGGPGCSSSLALLAENGPCSVNNDGLTTSKRVHSWTEAAHVLWLDQPAGVGFSYGSNNDGNEKMISEDTYYFLQAFFKTHPEYLESPLYITAESYGGHYAPAIAHKIFQENANLKESLLHLNLAGVAIGNGLTNPPEQYKLYPEMAYGGNSHGFKVVSESTYEFMKIGLEPCEKYATKCNEGKSALNDEACKTALLACNGAELIPYVLTGLNPYDMRIKCENPPLCYDFSRLGSWMNEDSTKTALHVSKKSDSWESCNFEVNWNFHGDWMKDFSGYVGDLLDAGIPVLIYAGDCDYICNYLGNQAWALKLDWKYKAEFGTATQRQWGKGTDGKPAGLSRTANGFTFLQVYDAGHMVPMNKPFVALEMINDFITGKIF
eukprot:CAMPEP_0197827100 /NCGR_PEP_ID=MMETSP1437-20131217/3961_1 /TAXON_ID=49252 ORGANISM="Eucampia antarctica, Strain CCMP1452" /NCGR_SAMPLE_ID=MMETSP1437 /ASSEMBLY_ACC=CAM_ASM_001096 /LENGTH=594 /DNA_ID=CAMNT_0043427829 /DNA_START=35 /DNA_END=1819 /DNA_ORIENTATION=-